MLPSHDRPASFSAEKYLEHWMQLHTPTGPIPHLPIQQNEILAKYIVSDTRKPNRHRKASLPTCHAVTYWNSCWIAFGIAWLRTLFAFKLNVTCSAYHTTRRTPHIHVAERRRRESDSLRPGRLLHELITRVATGRALAGLDCNSRAKIRERGFLLPPPLGWRCERRQQWRGSA